MLTLPAYTRDELVERARNLLRTRRRGIDVSHGSDYDLWSRILGAVAWATQKHAEAAFLLEDPRRAFGAYLDAYATEMGVGRSVAGVDTAATRARGMVILLGTGAATQPAGSLLRHADGTTYTLDADATTSAVESKTLYAGHRSTRRRLYQGHTGAGFATAVAGEIYLATQTGEFCALQSVDNQDVLERYLFDLYNPLDADPALHATFVKQSGTVALVTASAAGTRGNKDAKDTLIVESPISGVQAEAHILKLSGGASPMTPAELRAALATLLATRAPFGTLDDVRQRALETPGVPLGECFVSPDGLGSTLLLPMREDGPYVGAAERTALLARVRAGFSPADKFSTLSVYEARDTRIDVVNIQVAEIYRPDWELPNESVRGIALSASTISSITLATAAPTLAVGDRILIATRGAAGPYIVARRVTAIASLTLSLDAPLPFPPAVGSSYVTPGGALSEGLLETLYAAYEARAPSTAPATIRYPQATTSDAPEAILGALSRLEGVLDVAFHAGASPDLSVPGGVLVPACVLRMYA